MSDATINNGRQRKQLSEQLDRLDVILDGLADALNQSVADAVRDVVGAVVKDAVTTTIREVLGNPDLLRAALAKHGQFPHEQPAQVPQRRTLGGALKALCRKAREAASATGKALGSAWSWALGKLAAVATATKKAIALACMCPRTSVAALAAGVVTGVAVYYAGPVVAGVLCGLGSAAATTAGIALAPVLRMLFGSTDGD